MRLSIYQSLRLFGEHREYEYYSRSASIKDKNKCLTVIFKLEEGVNAERKLVPLTNK